jgi:hypothetical protein
MVVMAAVAMLASLNAPLFFALSGLFGYQYAGAEDSPVYVRYILFVFAITVLAFLYSCIKQPRITRAEAVFYAFAALLLCNHGVWVVLDPSVTSPVPQNLVFFIVFAVPAILAVRILTANKAWLHYVRLIEVVAIVMAVGIGAAVVAPFLRGIDIGMATGVSTVGGANTQAASYFAAFTFGLLGFYVFRVESELRYPWLTSRVGNLFNTALMAGLFVATILNGGRGAFILIVLYSSLIVYWVVTRHGVSYRSILRFLVVCAAVPVVLYGVFRGISANPSLDLGFRRAVAFISVGGTSGLFDLAGGGSGRDVFYRVAVAGIIDSPLWGYGAFGNWDRVTQPHNFFLDLALQFGIPIAAVLLALLTVWLLAKRKQWDSYKCFMMVMGLYPAVYLMFSGGYLTEPIFWVALMGFLTVDHQTANTRAAVAA